MQVVHGIEARQQATAPTFTPLAHETRPAVDTAAAAHYLSRRPQTLRGWACLEDGQHGEANDVLSLPGRLARMLTRLGKAEPTAAKPARAPRPQVQGEHAFGPV